MPLLSKNKEETTTSMMSQPEEAEIDPPDNNDLLQLQQAEDALLDGNFSRALQISHDLLLTTSKIGKVHLSPRRTDEPLLLPLSSGSSSSSALQQYHHQFLPYTSVAFISLHNVDGVFSRCGAVLLQSWYELCRRCCPTTSSSLPYYYLNSLLEQQHRPSVLPIDLLVVWMTLHQALLSTLSSSSSPAADDLCGSSQTLSACTDGNAQVALKVLEGLLLLPRTAETTALSIVLDKDRRNYRDYGRELIVLVFLEWLPTLPVRRIDELRAELLGAVGTASGIIADIPPDDDDAADTTAFLANDDCDENRASSSLLASRQFCLELFSAVIGHEWARETLQSCIAHLHDRWIKLQHRRTNEKNKARRALQRNGTVDNTMPRSLSSLRSHHHYRESSSFSTMTIKDRLLSFPITCCLRMLLWQRQHMHGTTTMTKKWFQYVVAAAFLVWGLTRVRSLCRHGVALLLSTNNNDDDKARPLSLVASVLLEALGLGRYYHHHHHATAPG
jgi:hypothetical protein